MNKIKAFERIFQQPNSHKKKVDISLTLHDLISIYNDVLHVRNMEESFCPDIEDLLERLNAEIRRQIKFKL